MKQNAIVVGIFAALGATLYLLFAFVIPAQQREEEQRQKAATKERREVAAVSAAEQKEARIKAALDKKAETIVTIKSSLDAGKISLAASFLKTLDEIKDDPEVVAVAATVSARQRKEAIADAKQYLRNGAPGQAREALAIYVKANDQEAIAVDKQAIAAQGKESAEAARIEKSVRKSSGVRIGMTAKEVLESSWGRPEHVNRTTTGRGTREQWVYGGRNYLYFENGILTTVQN